MVSQSAIHMSDIFDISGDLYDLSGSFYTNLANGGTQGTNLTSFSQDAGISLNSSDNEIVLKTANTTRLTIENDGHIGIGLITPTEKLHVNGNIKCTDLTIEGTLNVSNRHLATSDDTGNFHGNSGVSVSDYHTNFANLLGTATHGGLTSYQLSAGDNAAMSIIISSGGAFSHQVRNIQGYDTYRNNARNISLQLLGGNVGIGMTTPSEKLDVSGNIKCTDISCADLYSNKILTPSGNNKLYIIPNSKWPMSDTANNRVIHFGLMGADNNTGELRLGRQHADNRYHSIKVESDPNTTDNLMHFYLHYGTSTAPYDEQVNVMTLRGDGNVGIGTTTPSEKLDVNGTIKCTDLKFTMGAAENTLSSVIPTTNQLLPSLSSTASQVLEIFEEDDGTYGRRWTDLPSLPTAYTPTSIALPEFTLTADTNLNAQSSILFDFQDVNEGSSATTNYSAGITHTNNQATFIAREAGTYLISYFLHENNSQGSNGSRRMYGYSCIRRVNSSGDLIYEYTLGGEYARNRAPSDDLILSNTTSITFNAGEKFSIKYYRLYVQGTDNISVRQSLSNLRIERISINVT